MSEATVPLPEPEPQSVEERLADLYAANLRETALLISLIEEVRMHPDTARLETYWIMGLNRQADIGGDIREATETLKKRAVVGNFEQVMQARLAAASPPEPAPEPVRQRKPSGHRKRHLGLAAFAPAGGLGLLAKTWTTRRVAAAVLTAATAGAGVGHVITEQTAPAPYAASLPQAGTPDTNTSANPDDPSSSLIALSLTKPKPKAKHSAKGKTLLGVGLPVPSYPAPQPSASASSSSQPSPAVSVQAGPAVLTVSTTALNLTSLTSETITLSASGSGWVSWKVDTWDPQTQVSQTDLDFSATHGVLQAGQSVQVTVTVDPSQALDGDLSETFSIGGVSVTASLPAAAVPAVSVSPSAAPPISLLPSTPPSTGD